MVIKAKKKKKSVWVKKNGNRYKGLLVDPQNDIWSYVPTLLYQRTYHYPLIPIMSVHCISFTQVVALDLLSPSHYGAYYYSIQ